MKYLIVCSLCSGLMGLAANVGAEQPAVNSGQGGYSASSDPVNGSRSFKLSVRERNALSRSSEGLFGESIPLGGTKVDLQGRFQSGVFATVNEAGEVTISHRVPAGAGSIGQAGQGE